VSKLYKAIYSAAANEDWLAVELLAREIQRRVSLTFLVLKSIQTFNLNLKENDMKFVYTKEVNGKKTILIEKDMSKEPIIVVPPVGSTMSINKQVYVVCNIHNDVETNIMWFLVG
jgi:hypothetical protein